MNSATSGGAATIILSAGKLDHMELPVGTYNQSNAMVPVGGKPVIGWILDDLLSKNIDAASVVIRNENSRLRSFLDRVYGFRMRLEIVSVNAPPSILHSLLAALQTVDRDQPVRVVLGDTLIRDSFSIDSDFVYTGKVSDARRWCLVSTDPSGKIVAYHDKQSTTTSDIALAGYYHFQHGAFLRQCLQDVIPEGARELSQLLTRYGSRFPLQAHLAGDWLDFGHIDSLVFARHRLLQSRYFNQLSVDPVLDTITKVSEKTDVLNDEIAWYAGLPEELKVLTPRIIRSDEFDGQLRIVQEYYGYPTLSELYVYGELPEEIWTSIFCKLMKIHDRFANYSGELTRGEVLLMYLDKTDDRLALLVRQDDSWRALLGAEQIQLNGRTLANLPALQAGIKEKAGQLADSVRPCVLHGDLCFSNILFDIHSQIIRLVDPRGRFGRQGIHGDPRYDLAKLRHSISGRYDFILAGMFELQEEGSSFQYKLHSDNVQPLVCAFDAMLQERGFDPDEIRFIEGLLFVSMLPLHKGCPRRQKAMYLTGVDLLNEVLLCAS